jgi:hypothetical protein
MVALVESNLTKVQAALDRVFEKEPDQYIRLIARLASIALPKLAPAGAADGASVSNVQNNFYGLGGQQPLTETDAAMHLRMVELLDRELASSGSSALPLQALEHGAHGEGAPAESAVPVAPAEATAFRPNTRAAVLNGQTPEGTAP